MDNRCNRRVVAIHDLGMGHCFVVLCSILAGCAAPQTTPIANRSMSPIAPGPTSSLPAPARARRPALESEPGKGLAQALALPRIKVVVTTCSLAILGPVHFDPGSAQLTPAQRVSVDEIATTIARLQADQIIALEIVGHADRTEPDPRGLARSRARTVAAALQARGVSVAGVRGAGAARPLVSGGPRARNRHVDFVIVRRAEK